VTQDTPTLKQLRYFVTLAETGHYGRAAQRLGIAQASLSQQISNLEALLRLRLVERGRKGAVLSPEGRDVLERARRVLAEMGGLVDAAEAYRSGIAGTIRLGSTPTIGPYFLPGLARRLHRSHPDLKLVIREGPPRALREDLMAGLHDLILVQLPVGLEGTEVRRLFREPLRLVMARDHALAGRAWLDPSDLDQQDILSLSPAYALHGQIAALCADVGARLREDYEGTSLDAVRQMAAMGMGIAILPSLYVRSEIRSTESDLTVIDFRRRRFDRSIGLVWRSTSGKEARFERIAAVARDAIRDELSGLVTSEA